MKNKQDILKLHPMIGRLTPMQWDEIHKAMDAYLNEYKAEQLTLTDVGNCPFEAYAVFCIECDRQGMKPIIYKDYLNLG
jgi:hypothetical protein